jgi:chaperonin GroEL
MRERILKDITSKEDAKKLLMSGIDKVADVVSSTFGYRGRTVLIESDYGMPEPTKDGYKTLQSIFLEDAVENIACEIAKQASQKTVDFAGDATTSTIILLQAFFKLSIQALENGKSPIDIKYQIEKSRDLILEHLDKISTPITNKLIYDVAFTSANGEKEIADIVSDAFIKSGEDGSVAHFRSNTDETYLEFIEGTLLESGYVDERFTNVFSDRTCVFDNNPLVICSTIEFKTTRQILPFMKYAHVNKRPLVIISEVAPNVRDVVLQNVLENNVPFVVVNAPSFGKKRIDFLNDLAVLCNTQVINTLSGDDFEGREHLFLGECKKIIVGKTDTIITPMKTSDIQEVVDSKIAEIKTIIETTKNTAEKKYLRERISKLFGGVSIIKVGSIIESELQEKIDRVDDAVCAVRSAKEEGVLAGGGIALINAVNSLDLDNITSKSVSAPFYKLLHNADYEYSNIQHIEPVVSFWESIFGIKKEDDSFRVVARRCPLIYPMGYDLKEFKEVNMFDAGIVDSTKAIKYALINAVAASNTLLLTNTVLTNQRIVR